MSTTVIARGKVRRAGVQGRSIPPGVALDADGRPTTDADEAMAGSMLPLGGAKGSGLAVAVMLLGALLADADFDDEVASIYADAERPQNLGQLFLAIDPWRVADREIAARRMEAAADRLHGLRPQEGVDAVRYPGEASAERARLRAESGIPVPCRDLEAIADAAEDCGLPDLVLRARELAGAAPRSAGALG
jgi:LDH2 family malate/lactate/ureidoglycolate dehydrogenase